MANKKDKIFEADQKRKHKIFSSCLGVKGNKKTTVFMVDYLDEPGIRAFIVTQIMDKSGKIIDGTTKEKYYPNERIVKGNLDNRNYFYISGEGIKLWLLQ